MARVIGIDPGTLSFDICGLDDGELFLDTSLPTEEVARSPERLVDALSEGLPVDLIAGPSGYGLSNVPIDRLSERDFTLAYLPGDAHDEQVIVGLRGVIAALRQARLPVVLTPGVIHLPSVPAYRKANRIDMGTADKVCVAALAIDEQARRFDLEFEATSCVLVELGGAFSAVMAVDRGRIVDGQGGSSGPMGHRAAGALDGELAYLLGDFPKSAIFSGGAAYIAGAPESSPEQLAEASGPAAEAARNALEEAVLKAVAAEHALVPHAREILLSGRLSRLESLVGRLRDRLSRFGPVRRVGGFAKVAKGAAQGAALLADGLAGGDRQRLVDTMGIRDAAGTALDHLFVLGADGLRAEMVG